MIPNFLHWDSGIAILCLVFFLCFRTLLLFMMVKLIKDLTNSDSDMNMKELFLAFRIILAFRTIFGAGIAAAFVVQKEKLCWYFLYFLLRIFYEIIRNVIGAGLFCGFMTTATLGYLYYFFLVSRFFFDNFEDSFFFEHHQKRVGEMTSFVTGQFIMFTSVYDRPIHQRLVQTDCLFLLFLGFFVLQLLWTHQTIVRNWRFLYPNDKRKRVVRRVLLLQLEFSVNFFLQLSLLPSNSYIERHSMVRRLVNTYLKDEGKKIFFVRSSFVGWLIGHILFMIFYMKLFEFIIIITIWVRKNFFESEGK